MNGRKGIQTTAVIALVLMVLWVISALSAFVWQDTLQRVSITDISLLEEADKVIVAADVVRYIFCIPAAISCIMVMLGKGRLGPLILSFVPAVLMPVAVYLATTLQMMYINTTAGTAMVVRFSSASTISGRVAYLLHVACILAVALTAVYWCQKKQSAPVQNPYEEETK